MIGFRTGKSWIGVTVWLKDRKCQTQTLLLVIGVVSDNVRWQGLSGHILTWHCEVLLSSAWGLDYQDNGECKVSRNQCCLLLGLCWGRGLDTALDGNSVYMGDRHLAWKCPFLLSWRTPLSLEGAFRISWTNVPGLSLGLGFWKSQSQAHCSCKSHSNSNTGLPCCCKTNKKKPSQYVGRKDYSYFLFTTFCGTQVHRYFISCHSRGDIIFFNFQEKKSLHPQIRIIG